MEVDIMEKLTKKEMDKLCPGGVKWYREKIVEMVEKIENQRFLKAIYISMSDYLKENEPD